MAAWAGGDGIHRALGPAFRCRAARPGEHRVIHGLSGHLNTLYAAEPPVERLRAAACDGFMAVEIWEAPAPPDAGPFLTALVELDLRLTSVNTSGGTDPLDFGLLGQPSEAARWRADFTATLEFARTAGARAINVLGGRRISGVPRSAQWECLLSNLQWALSCLTDPADPLLLLEPLNGVDRASPLLRRPSDVLSALAELGHPPRLRMLFDAYHVHQETDGVLSALSAAGDALGHVQLADYPGRAEPGTGTIPVAALIEELAASEYDGWLGLEYFPRRDAASSLGWLNDLSPVASEWLRPHRTNLV
ncbi:MAG: hydroxypyruvate isomerase [Frankiaceae bacterium]|nr:hydroxypyruvate isomerase [Frankiaceae bacterium]